MELEWPQVEPGVLAFLQRVFAQPWRLEAAFDDDQDCSDLLRSEFPLMVDEELHDSVAALMTWKVESSPATQAFQERTSFICSFRFASAQCSQFA